MNGNMTKSIIEESFAVIDAEVGDHDFSPAEYAIVRRIIHSTADFEFTHLTQFSPGAIEAGISALRHKTPIITDVGMVKQGIMGMVDRTLGNPVISAVEQATTANPGQTRTETGLLKCWEQYPEAIYVIGNAPTALLALCRQLTTFLDAPRPALVIGVPVGFISVLESKDALEALDIPQIRTKGRKGGSPVAAAIVNALLQLAVSSEQLSVISYQ